MRTMLVASLVVLAACRGDERSSAAIAPADAARLLVDRNWMDRWPTDARQRLEVYRFTPSMGGGVYQDRTLFVGRFELFNFDAGEQRIRIRWPDRGLTEEFGYRIVPTDGPAPFDLRLELDGNRVGPRVLYGRRAETHEATDVDRALARP